MTHIAVVFSVAAHGHNEWKEQQTNYKNVQLHFFFYWKIATLQVNSICCEFSGIDARTTKKPRKT